MDSFEVESILTNVPIETACSIAQQRVQVDRDFTNYTNLSPSQVTNLLEFVLGSAYSLYNRNFYEQLEGVAMGSPVFAIKVKLFMVNFNSNPVMLASRIRHPDLEEISRRHLHSQHKIHCK